MTKPAKDRVAGEFNPAGRLTLRLTELQGSQKQAIELPKIVQN
jgi:hypothetical protein